MKAHFRLAVKAVISFALLWYVFQGMDTGSVPARLAKLDPAWAGAAVFVLALQILIAAQRWRDVLAALSSPLPPSTVLRIVLVGLFFNQTLPSSLGGDVVRAWMARSAGVRLGTAANSVLMDRLAALAATMLVVVLGLPVLFGLFVEPNIRLGIVSVVAAGAGGFLVLFLLDVLPGPPRHWRLTGVIHAVAVDARKVLLRAGTAARCIGLSAAITLGTGLSVYLLARGLSIQVGLLDTVVLVPLVILTTLIPISIAGWGVREIAMVTAFGYAGVSPAEALALSISFGLAVMLTGLPGGVAWLAGSRGGQGRQAPLGAAGSATTTGTPPK